MSSAKEHLTNQLTNELSISVRAKLLRLSSSNTKEQLHTILYKYEVPH
jgi:hypothetical protein